MKRQLTLLLIALSLLLCGCSGKPPLHNTSNAITRIELYEKNQDEYQIIYELSGENVALFMNQLLDLQCTKRLHPVEGWGTLVIYIYYQDGYVDILGSHTNGYIKNGEIVVSGWYYYDEDSLRQLFEDYS